MIITWAMTLYGRTCQSYLRPVLPRIGGWHLTRPFHKTDLPGSSSHLACYLFLVLQHCWKKQYLRCQLCGCCTVNLHNQVDLLVLAVILTAVAGATLLCGGPTLPTARSTLLYAQATHCWDYPFPYQGSTRVNGILLYVLTLYSHLHDYQKPLSSR